MVLLHTRWYEDLSSFLVNVADFSTFVSTKFDDYVVNHHLHLQYHVMIIRIKAKSTTPSQPSSFSSSTITSEGDTPLHALSSAQVARHCQEPYLVPSCMHRLHH